MHFFRCLCSGEIGLTVNSCRLSLISRVILNDAAIFIQVNNQSFTSYGIYLNLFIIFLLFLGCRTFMYD